jgi:very-short-patch-repair endonuclease
MKGQRKTTQTFIEQSRSKFGDRFDYSKTNYLDAKSEVVLRCLFHDKEICTTPDNHLKSKHGCRDCSIAARAKARTKYTTDGFRAALRKKYGDHLDFSATVYAGGKEKATFICSRHGEKIVEANYLLSDDTKYGCRVCYAESQRAGVSSLVDRFREAHGSHKFNYENVALDPSKVAWHQPIEVFCNEHSQTFFPTAADHYYRKVGCEACRVAKIQAKTRKSQEQFLQEALNTHGTTYLYDRTKYSGDQEDVEIGCRVHGYFEQRADHHLKGSGCSACYNKGEGRLAEILKNITNFRRQYKVNVNGAVRFFDFLLIDQDILIERDGEQHYPELWSRETSHLFTNKGRTYAHQVANDAQKLLRAKELGFTVARIPYWLEDEEVKIEVSNIINGTPSYGELPNPQDEKTKKRPIASVALQ